MTKNQTIRILHISLSSQLGGGPEHIYQLANALDPDITSYIASPDDLPYAPKFKQTVTNKRWTFVPHRSFTISHLFSICRFIKNNKIDIIHSHGKGAGIYGRLASLITQKKSVHTFHGIHLQYRLFLKLLYSCLEFCLSKLTHAIISVSKTEADKAKLLKFTTTNQCHIINNGVVIPPHLAKRDAKAPFTIVHMTRFDVAKNSELLIPIAHALKNYSFWEDIHFVVLGTGEGQQACKNAASQAGVEDMFTFAGFQSAPRDILRGEKIVTTGRASCYISTSRWEGLPLAILEALSEGIPIIATDVTGNNDAVLHQTDGFLYPLEAPEVAARHIASLYESHSLWEQLASNARKSAVDNFSLSQQAKRTAQVYRQLLK